MNVFCHSSSKKMSSKINTQFLSTIDYCSCIRDSFVVSKHSMVWISVIVSWQQERIELTVLKEAWYKFASNSSRWIACFVFFSSLVNSIDDLMNFILSLRDLHLAEERTTNDKDTSLKKKTQNSTDVSSLINIHDFILSL